MNKAMNTNDLYLNYARVIKMCKNTALEDTPWVCIRIDGESIHGAHPGFRLQSNRFTFAVEILEDKPVFVGDKLYRKHDGKIFLAKNSRIEREKYSIDHPYFNYYSEFSDIEEFTWQPPAPKRTFTLSCFKLPCPLKALPPNKERHMLQIHNNAFYFETNDDYLKTCGAIISILSGAKNK